MQIKKMSCPGAIESFRELQRNFRGNSEEFGLFSGILADSAANGAQTAQKVPSKAQRADEAPTTGIAPTGIAGMRLPVRLAEIGLVHRAERSGQLHGLMRVREFTQDDAHIFCLMPQVQTEILRVLRLMDEVYTVLGLRYELELSTRPADRIGADEVWDAAEDALKGALEAGGRAWKVNEGDGAFYGPKIDVHVKDRMGRSWQCGTIQMDFNLPERFDLWVNDGERKVRPVMLHRVIYGSIERFIGILTEHFKGRFPLWLAPKQVRVIPLKSEFEDYARQVGERLTAAGLRVDGDFRDETVRKRVKVATLDLVPYTVVIGAKEAAGGDLHIKRLGGEDFELPLGYFVKFVEKKVAAKALGY